MKKLILFMACIAISITSWSQMLQGKISAENGDAISKATITLHRAKDSALLRTALSVSDGSFEINISDSIPVLLQVTASGYTGKWINPEKQKDLSGIQLATAPKSMDAVVVTVKKPIIEVKPDKLVFNVEASINATGSTALELLQKSPGVIVDKDDNIQLSGKNGVRIYIDGKPSPLAGTDLAAYLRGMNRSDIEAIEIITNPSAKYDAEGNAGIINIRLKKNKNYGVNGNISGGYGIGIYSKYNGGGSLNYRNKKVNLFTNYSAYNNLNANEFDLYRVQNDTTYDQQSNSKFHSRGQNLKMGADWYLDKKSTIGFVLNGNIGHNNWNSFSTTPISASNIKEIDRILVANSESESKRKNLTANINYRYADTSGRELNIDADLGRYRLRSENQTPNVYVTSDTSSIISTYTFSSTTPTDIDLYSLKADYEQKLGKGKITTGFKTSLVKTDNNFSFYENDTDGVPVLNPNRSNQFEYTEWINALYGQYRLQWKKMSLQAGLRMEQTQSKGELTASADIDDKLVKRSYLDFFPNAGLTWQAHKNHTLGLSYSRRIDRPRYQDLNPFEYQLDELTYRKGNPFLLPQYTNIVELRHTFKNKLTTTLSYSHITDVFAQVTDTISGNKSYIQQRNLAEQDIISLSVNFPFNLTKWWSVYTNGNLYNTQYNAVFEDQKEIDLNATVFSIYMQQTFKLGKGWTTELSGFYNSPSIWGGTYETSAIWNLDLGVQKKFWKDNATLRVSVTDIFFTMPWTGVSEFGGLYIFASGQYESRQLKANFNWRFGNKQVKASRNRKSGIDDLNQRVD